MKVTIEKEVNKCSECPYFTEITDMGGKIFFCSIDGMTLDYVNPYEKICDRCQLKSRQFEKKVSNYHDST